MHSLSNICIIFSSDQACQAYRCRVAFACPYISHNCNYVIISRCHSSCAGAGAGKGSCFHAGKNPNFFYDTAGDYAGILENCAQPESDLPIGDLHHDFRHGAVQHGPCSVLVKLGSGHAQQPDLFRPVSLAVSRRSHLSDFRMRLPQPASDGQSIHSIWLRAVFPPVARLHQRL